MGSHLGSGRAQRHRALEGHLGDERGGASRHGRALASGALRIVKHRCGNGASCGSGDNTF
eukprot:7780341-Pyramimonas_sp.AAC.1